MQKKPDFKTSFLALMEGQGGASHPTAEALAAYRGGALAAEERARVHAHLAACPECAELAADLDLFTEAASSAKEKDEFEVAAFLRTLRPQLTPQRSAPKASWHLPLAMAASLVVAVAGSWWLSHGVTQRQMLAEMSRPRGNVSILDLVADKSERTGSPARTVEMVADTGGVLILTPDGPGSFPAYQAKILDSEGRQVVTIEDLVKNSRDDTFTLWIPPGSLAPGDYRVELYGLSGERAEVIAGYPIRLVGSPEATP